MTYEKCLNILVDATHTETGSYSRQDGQKQEARLDATDLNSSYR